MREMDNRQELEIIESLKAADVMHQKGLTDKAIETLVNCIRINPDDKKIYYELVRIFIETKRFSDAWAVLETMPDHAKNHLKGLECAGYTHEGMGNHGQADHCANRMLAIHEKHPAALNLKGMLAQKQGDNGTAEDYYLKAILANSDYGEAYINLGLLYWEKGIKEHALGCIKQGFVLTPAIPDVSSIYYSASRSLGMFGPAETDFNEALKRYPYNKNLAFLCIDVLLQQSKFEEALRKIEDVLDMFGLDDNVLNSALSVRRTIGPLQADPSGAAPALSLCMIVKNEEKYLLQCLKSVRDIVDEIIVVDTGSSDKTKAIAEIFGAKLFDFPWTGDFSAARNYSLKQATGRWILILDADEVISPKDHPKIQAIISGNSSSASAYSIATRNYQPMTGTLGWVKNSGEYPEEAGTGWTKSDKVRLFIRNDRVYFIDPVHELLEYSLKREGIPICSCGVLIHHYGMMDNEKKQQKGVDYYHLGKTTSHQPAISMQQTQQSIQDALKLHDSGNHSTALNLMEEILTSQPNNIVAMNIAAICLQCLGNTKEAERYWRMAVQIKPDYKDAYYNLGTMLHMLKRFSEAEECYRRVLAICPDHTETYNNLGILLHMLKRFSEAEECYRRALTICPDFADAHNNLGNLLKELKRFSEAEECYRRFLVFHPNSAVVYNNLGVLLKELKRFSEAEECYRHALAIRPVTPTEAKWNLSLLLLSLGRLDEGWPLFEARYDPNREEVIAKIPDLSFPQWAGESLLGKSIVVCMEQGYGDEIQFVRYIPLLKARGAARITLACQQPLKTLFQNISGADQVITRQDASIEKHDFWTFLLSLPMHFKTTLATIPNQLPYLTADNDRCSQWAMKLPKTGFKVGVVWKGAGHHKNDINRSLPGLETLKPLWSISGISFISLQKGNGEDEAAMQPQDQPILDLGPYIRDFADTAAIIAQLDLIICVDTAIAHLAGALGKPIWVLLPRIGTDWRWMEGREDSPWYPDVMRLFRQTGEGWAETIENLGEALRKRLTDCEREGFAFEPLVPNKETIKAMKAARRGDFEWTGSADKLLDHLNVDK